MSTLTENGLWEGGMMVKVDEDTLATPHVSNLNSAPVYYEHIPTQPQFCLQAHSIKKDSTVRTVAPQGTSVFKGYKTVTKWDNPYRLRFRA